MLRKPSTSAMFTCLPFAERKALVAEIEAEQVLINANRELIERMEAKIQSVLARIWGE